MWEEFLEKYYWEDVIALSNEYPEKRSLYVRFTDVLKYDIHLADLLLNDPDVALQTASEALRTFDIQTGVSLENAVVRIVEIPSSIRIRDIRSEDIGRLICVEGLVLKVTEVRPKMVSAAFECPLCHNVFFVPRITRFKEPEKCDICDRKARGFRLVVEKSKFINAQKIRIQESPEELRGGELPQTIDVNLEEDLTGLISPGERIKVTGILRSYQMQNSPFFGIFIEGVSIEKSGEEFEEIEITEEDERRIKEFASLPDAYERLKNSIAPFIYGYERIKEALLLQLFGGVPKELPDGTKIRGDIHILLVGDPGVAKCVSGDTEIVLADGSVHEIRALSHSISGFVDDGVFMRTDLDVFSMSSDGKITSSKGDLLWKRIAPQKLLRIRTKSGREIEVTPSHPFFTSERGRIIMRKAEHLKAGDFIATPRKIKVRGEPQSIVIGDKIVKTTPEFWRFMGIITAEGRFVRHDSCNFVFRDGVRFSFCKSLLDTIGFSESDVPKLLFKCTKREISAFISALLGCDAKPCGGSIRLTSSSRKLLAHVQHLLLRFGILSRIHRVRGAKNVYYLLISGDYFVRAGDDAEASRWRNDRRCFCSMDVIPNISSLLREIRRELGMAHDECGVRHMRHYESGERNPTRRALNRIIERFERRMEDVKRRSGFRCSEGESSTECSCSGALSDYPMSAEEIESVRKKVEVLKKLANSDIFWDEISDIEEIKPSEPYVYDIQVPFHHNFVANDIFVHNSQMLSYIAELAPRGIYTGGKSATSAGLTAAAVKDDFGEGRWTLEAGALVLADKGIAAIDEIDKMEKRDRDAMHEVLEQQSYHPSFSLELADGVYKIGDFVESIFRRYAHRVVRGIRCEIIWTDDLNIEILSTDFRSIFRTRVNRVSRHEAPDYFVRIKYENGKEILVTPEHPVFVMRDCEIHAVESSKVEIGDFSPATFLLSVCGMNSACEMNREMATQRHCGVHAESAASWCEGCVDAARGVDAARDADVARGVDVVRKPHSAAFTLLRVIDVEIVPNEGRYRTKWVYDVTVEPTHTFISHGLILHNTVSIAKAGITARLNARCALLAAANPKLGRFDKYTPISEQINLPPTLLSRFDLIFTMMDEPDEVEDRKTAEYILDSHIYGEILMRKRIAMKGDLKMSEVMSDISTHISTQQTAPDRAAEYNEVMRRVSNIVDAELLRKYVAYARKNIIPVLSEGARRRFLDFYINLRRQSYGNENAPVPVTARQLEALIRLGEARARASLRDVVVEEDAECVIDLVSYCLNRVFVDPETGKLDVDVVTIGTPKTRRDRMKMLLDIIKELGREYGSDVVPIEEVLDIAEERGIDRQKAEELIEKLKREGLLYAPRNDMIKIA